MTKEEQALPKSPFKLGDKTLDQLSHAELLDAVNSVWEAKNGEVTKLKAERDGLRQLLSSSLPIHSLWRGCAENAMLLWFVAMMAYLVGAHK